mgnify:CR=1 FL=1
MGTLWDDMRRAMATVTAGPARGAGSVDRGQLAEGLRADLLRFRLPETVPVLRGVRSAGPRLA